MIVDRVLVVELTPGLAKAIGVAGALVDRAARTDGGSLIPHEWLALVADVAEFRSAMQHRAAASSGVVPKAVPTPRTSASVDHMTSRQVADRVGITVRAVTKAALAGRLPGVRLDGAWHFEPDAVAAFGARRGAA